MRAGDVHGTTGPDSRARRLSVRTASVQDYSHNPRVVRPGGCRFKPTPTSADGLIRRAVNSGVETTRLRDQDGAIRARSNGLPEDHQDPHRRRRERESRLNSQPDEDCSPRGPPAREPDARHDCGGDPHQNQEPWQHGRGKPDERQDRERDPRDAAEEQACFIPVVKVRVCGEDGQKWPRQHGYEGRETKRHHTAK